MREFVFDEISARDAAPNSYFRKRTVTKLLARHEQDGRYAKEVFCLLVLALWHRQFAGATAVACAA